MPFSLTGWIVNSVQGFRTRIMRFVNRFRPGVYFRLLVYIRRNRIREDKRSGAEASAGSSTRSEDRQFRLGIRSEHPRHSPGRASRNSSSIIMTGSSMQDRDSSSAVHSRDSRRMALPNESSDAKFAL